MLRVTNVMVEFAPRSVLSSLEPNVCTRSVQVYTNSSMKHMSTICLYNISFKFTPSFCLYNTSLKYTPTIVYTRILLSSIHQPFVCTGILFFKYATKKFSVQDLKYTETTCLYRIFSALHQAFKTIVFFFPFAHNDKLTTSKEN